MTPFPTQISGAEFLAERRNALLADEPRVGKTGAAIMALDKVNAFATLVVTTASGRAVWRRAMRDWSIYDRRTQVLFNGQKLDPKTPNVIVGWASITDARIRVQLLTRDWDRVILDESHYAKDLKAARTRAAYGEMNDEHVFDAHAVTRRTDGVWCLTGTPIPNALNDLFPMMRALCPERLEAHDGMPDVTTYARFERRYCVVRPMLKGGRRIQIVVNSQNGDELRRRLKGFMLLRTQKDVGIREPIYETFPLAVPIGVRKQLERNVDVKAILAAAERDDTRKLEMDMGPLRRLTGTAKAHAVVEAVTEEFAGGLDKIVLAYWHTDVGDILRAGLAKFGVVSIDGAATASDRERAELRFRNDKTVRVCCAQIAAAGEAIDLSAAALLLFVESTFSPAQMKQMSLRITNYTQTRQCFVRVAVLEGSIDEALETVLLRKWSNIREVLQ